MLHSNRIVRMGSLFAMALAAVACGSTDEGEASPDADLAVASSPEACSWAGTWNGTWTTPIGDIKSPFVVTQEGGALSGNYRVDAAHVGVVHATVKGNAFSGTWRRTVGTSGGPCDYGDLNGEMSADCKSFSGKWYWCNGAIHIRGGSLKATR